MRKVLVIGKVHERGLDLVRARADVALEVVVEESESAFRDRVADADAIAVRTAALRNAVLERAAKLKIVARHGVGYDNIDVAYLTGRRIPLAIAAGANTIAVAEHTLQFMLALAKQPSAYDRATRAGEFGFRNSLRAFELFGKTLLIVGLGRIGREVALRCRAFGMNLVAYDPFIAPEIFARHGCRQTTDLHAALAEADVVTLHFPGGGNNVGFIGRAELARMKPSALLINCARGDIIDEGALHDALKSKRLAGAGLDVFVQEPTPASNPLFTLDNVIVSPHSAALSQESAVRMAITTLQNVLDGLDGKLDPTMVVNPEVLPLVSSR